MHLKSVQIREVVFGGNDLIRGVVSFEVDSVVVFYYLSASEICPDKRGGVWCRYFTISVHLKSSR